MWTTTVTLCFCLFFSSLTVPHVTGGVVAGGGDTGDVGRTCWFSSPASHLHNITGTTTTQQQQQEKCVKSSNFCYSLWREEIVTGDANNTQVNVVVIAQGCWEASGKQECDRSLCISERRPVRLMNNTNFCCCMGDLCNMNMSHSYSDVTTTAVGVNLTSPTLPTYTEQSYIMLGVVIAVSVVLCLVTVVLLYRLHARNMTRHSRDKQASDSLHLIESCNCNMLENLKLEQIIGQGRYGCVWSGTLGEQQVAVKIFSHHHKNYYHNERDIYSLPFMEHSSLLSYYGCDERTGSDGNPEYLLLLSLAPHGSLFDYLKLNTIDWTTFCSMCLSLAKGLAHLHTDITKGDKIKPCVSHRDLNSRNVLVKEDLSCVVSDLGFSTKINGAKYYHNGEEQHAETKSIHDVGTLRYMSPEVLEGAVNLRDCETSLKQIDVYSLGLILWEIATRCSDLYPNCVECPEYKMPFEAEIGHHPTLEQMQTLVCKHKARPLFPDAWCDTSAVRTVKETIEDCWDQDAEARLTSLCVEERFHELSGVADRYKRGHVCNVGVSPSVIQKDSHNVFAVVNNNNNNNNSSSHNDGGDNSCVSESTVETLLTTSSSNLQISTCKNSNQYQTTVTSVQPYQGRNPCLERNLMSTSEDGSCRQQELIDKSLKHVTVDGRTTPSDYLNTMLLGHQSYHHHQQNSYTNHSEPVARANTPIPYVQNVVYSDYVVPKQSNLNKTTRRSVGVATEKKQWRKFRRLVDFFKPDDCSSSNNVDKTNLLSTPDENKIDMLVDIRSGRAETKLTTGKQQQQHQQPYVLVPKPKREIISELTKQNNRRPTSLPLKECRGNNNNKNEEPDDVEVEKMRTNNVFKLKDPSSRVKTPGDLSLAMRKDRVKKNATRFSLYDDRIMSGLYDSDDVLITCSKNKDGRHNFVFNSFEEMNFTQNV